jgi:SAM-dependent methyltransferase
MIHEDRRRAGSFGEEADLYDRARPSYPAEMIDALMETGPRRVLDVGCGTGLAGRLFAARGCEVLGVEPDERMAVVARSHALAVELVTFETWDSAGRTYDLLICGQAWHWVDPVSGSAKAAQVVRQGATIALFWNQGRADGDMQATLNDIYRRVAPDVEKYSILLHATGADRVDGTARILETAGTFAPPRITTYPWSTSYATDEWLDHLLTHSDHRTMDPETRRRLMDEVRAAIDASGGRITINYACAAVTATRL